MLRRYNSDNYNIYVGVNPRLRKGSKKIDVAGIKNIVIDVEGVVKKPYSDEDYLFRLKKGMEIIKEVFYSTLGLRLTLNILSGRGFHLYFSLTNISSLITDSQIKVFMDEFFGDDSKATKDLLDIGLKIDNQVTPDCARILGCVGTVNTKYPEKPLRTIDNFILGGESNPVDVFNSLEKITDDVRSRKKSSVSMKRVLNNSYSSSYDEESIFFMPEVQLLAKYGDSLPEGKRYSHLVFAIKLKMKECELENYDEVIDFIQDGPGGGFSVPPGIDGEFPPEDDFNEYVYNTALLRNWCLSNSEWCLDNNYLLPEKYLPRKSVPIQNGNKLIVVKDNLPVRKNTIDCPKDILSYSELIKFIRNWHRENSLIDDGLFEYNHNQLMYDLSRFCDETFLRYCKKIGLLNRVLLKK